MQQMIICKTLSVPAEELLFSFIHEHGGELLEGNYGVSSTYKIKFKTLFLTELFYEHFVMFREELDPEAEIISIFS